jgi:type IV pilus assembly protein PilB
MSPPPAQKTELGQILVQQNLLTPAQLNQAQTQQKATGRPLGQILVDLEMVSEEDVTKARAQQSDMAYTRVQDLTVDRNVLPLVDAGVARRHLILPMARTPDGTLKIVVAAWNPVVMEAASKVASANRLRIAPTMATESHLRSAIEHYYEAPAAVPMPNGAGQVTAPGGAVRHAVPVVIPPSGPAEMFKPPPATPQTGAKRPSEMFASAMAAPTRSSSAPSSALGLQGGTLDEIGGGEEVGVDQPIVIQFVNRILADAINKKASDIHFEPRRDSLVIRYRIDGTLHNVDSIRREYQAAVASRLKIMAEMNIAERRLPQDGRIAVTMDSRAIDLRVSSWTKAAPGPTWSSWVFPILT